jgi:hypothetical protein
MTKRIRLRGGNEYDVFSKSRKFLIFKRGQVKKIKRAYNKRFRRQCKDALET